MLNSIINTGRTVKIGRREFDYSTFETAVQNAKTYSEVADNLDLNKTVQTTINFIKEKVAELGLDTTHFTYKYVITDALLQAAKENRKQFNISEVNKEYYSAFEQSFDKVTSWQQYKVSAGAFLESLGRKDFATITVRDLETYVDNKKVGENAKKNCKAHIRSMMAYAVKNNVSGAFDKVSKEMLIYLI